jgi:prevent-host-death family protein
MQTATVTDLRLRAGKLLKAVDRGETVRILYRGREIAHLIPVTATPRKREDIRDAPAFGMWADRKDMEDAHAWLRKMRRNRRAR